MKKLFVLLLIAIFPIALNAQNCNSKIDYNSWWSVSTTCYGLSWNETGTKLFYIPHSGASYDFGGTTRYSTILNFDTDTINLNATLSKNVGASAGGFYGPNGIYFPGTWQGNSSIVKPDGTTMGLATSVNSGNRSIDGNYAVYKDYTGGLHLVNATDPLNPIVTNITPTLPSGYALGSYGGCKMAMSNNRIYLVGQTSDVDQPIKITCVQNNGATCPNWTDVTISTGTISDLQIRKTDRMIFARTANRSGGQNAQPGGLVIFDSAGTLATGFNWTDLSLLTAGGGQVRFDAAGNIFGNMTSTDAQSGIGLYKFDPKGNVDISFIRNMTNSYEYPGMTNYNYIDVNPVTGLIAASVYNGGAFHALAGGNHIQTNDELWSNSFPNNGTGSGAAPARKNPDGYYALHLIYNNGKLKVMGENANTATSNCGPQTPKYIPNNPDAKGTIQCGQLSFIQAPVQGTPSTIVLKVPVQVDSVGDFRPITVTGSGMKLQKPADYFTTTTTGLNYFYVTLNYDGTTLGNFTITVGSAGSCMVDLSDHTKTNPSVIDIWTPQNCTYKVIGPNLK